MLLVNFASIFLIHGDRVFWVKQRNRVSTLLNVPCIKSPMIGGGQLKNLASSSVVNRLDERNSAFSGLIPICFQWIPGCNTSAFVAFDAPPNTFRNCSPSAEMRQFWENALLKFALFQHPFQWSSNFAFRGQKRDHLRATSQQQSSKMSVYLSFSAEMWTVTS